MNVLQTIRENYRNLTKAEQQIADTILQNPRAVLECSISELSQISGVKSEASVVKFYRKIGLTSFQQFKVLNRTVSGLRTGLKNSAQRSRSIARPKISEKFFQNSLGEIFPI
jgi:DNA-binding MurR/RpiR family transcriptional regulator